MDRMKSRMNNRNLRSALSKSPLLGSLKSEDIKNDAKNNLNLSNNQSMQQNDLKTAYLTLFILILTFASNQWSRQAIYYLCDFSSNANAFNHMNIELKFDKEQYSLLASLAFTLVFAFFSLIAGNVSDLYNRSIVTSISCFFWSLGTLFQGYATSYNQLLGLRSLIGGSESFYNPAAYTLLSDLFPKDMVGRINGIFSGGVYLGGGLASLSILIDEKFGWRKTLLAIGAFGFFTSVLCLFTTDPRKAVVNPTNDDRESLILSDDNVKDKEKTVPKNVKESITVVFSAIQDVISSNDVKLLLVATAFRFCAGFSIGIWKAPLVFSKFPNDVSTFAGSNALIVSLGGLLSSFLGSFTYE
jgi:MFS family permease